MVRILSTLVLSVVACLHLGTAHAQSCGDTVTHDITLTADLHCTTGWFALYVPTHGVTVDLDGHTISGSRDLVGISINDAVSVRIVNGVINSNFARRAGGGVALDGVGAALLLRPPAEPDIDAPIELASRRFSGPACSCDAIEVEISEPNR